MHWKIKAFIQKVLSYSTMSDRINHLNALSGRHYYSNGVTYHFREFFQKFNLIKGFDKQSFPKRNALEIGTGYFMVEPIIVSLLGFREIFTVDISKDVN